MYQVGKMAKVQCHTDKHQIFYALKNSTQRQNGVPFVVGSRWDPVVMRFVPISTRIALIKINNKPCLTSATVRYAPKTESNEEDSELFYEILKKVLKNTKMNGITLLGNFIAKIGKKQMNI